MEDEISAADFDSALRNFTQRSIDSFTNIAEDQINSFPTLSLPKGVLGYELWQMYLEGLVTCPVAIYSEMSIMRPSYGWKINSEVNSDIFHLLVSVRSVSGIPEDKLEKLQFILSLWHEDVQLSDEFVVDLNGQREGIPIPKPRSSTLFTNLQLTNSASKTLGNSNNIAILTQNKIFCFL
jgi:hypothetical protein